MGTVIWMTPRLSLKSDTVLNALQINYNPPGKFI